MGRHRRNLKRVVPLYMWDHSTFEWGIRKNDSCGSMVIGGVRPPGGVHNVVICREWRTRVRTCQNLCSYRNTAHGFSCCRPPFLYFFIDGTAATSQLLHRPLSNWLTLIKYLAESHRREMFKFPIKIARKHRQSRHTHSDTYSGGMLNFTCKNQRTFETSWLLPPEFEDGQTWCTSADPIFKWYINLYLKHNHFFCLKL
jgi:hypothetical protein